MMKKIKMFVQNNILNLSTLFIAILALVVAIQSNILSKEANQITLAETNPRVSIFSEDSFRESLIVITGEYDCALHKYRTNRSTTDIFTIVNNGGKSTSLIDVSFYEGDDKYYEIEIYNRGNRRVPSDEVLIMPLDVEPGSGKIWQITANTISFTETKLEALEAVNLSYPLPTELPGIKQPARWIFEFSDGSVITKIYKDGWYSIDPFLYEHLSENCN